MPQLTYHDATHTYQLDGVRIPSVNEILDSLGKRPWYPNGIYKQRGTAVHLATLLYDRGELESVGPSLEPYMEAYRKFRKEIRMDVVCREEPRYHPTMLYAGRPDIGAIDCDFGAEVVIDLKCSDSKPDKCYALQLAAYAPLVFPNTDVRRIHRVVANLRSDGNWEHFTLNNPNDWEAWRGAVALYKWERAT